MVASGSRDLRWGILYAGLALVAFGIRLLLMLRGGGLLGVGGYDDGVYYAAAAALVHGRMPYTDFLFLQPPGVVLAGVPFAGIGALTTDSTGFIAARLGFMAIGALNTVLVAAILRRFGFTAATAGGFFYAVAYVAAYGERSILLEPVGTLGILAALAVVARPALRGRAGWLFVAGVALGVATGFKIWYLVPAAIIIAWSGRHGWWRMLLGAVAGGCATYLPFFLADPAASFREIVLDQLGRTATTTSLGARVHMILGDYAVPPVLAKLGLNTVGLTIVMALVCVAAVAVALTVRTARLYVVLFAADSIVLLTAPSFFLHYTALTSPMMALVFGVALGRIAARVRVRGARVALAGGIAVLLVAANAPQLLRGAGTPAPVAALTADARSVRGCIMAADPTMLAVSNVLSRDLVQRCRFWPDVTGETYGPYRRVLADGRSVPRIDNPAWQDALVDYLTSGAAVIVSRNASTGYDAASYRMLTHEGRLLYREPGLAFVRTPVHQP